MDYFKPEPYDESCDHWQVEIGSFAIHGRDEEPGVCWLVSLAWMMLWWITKR